MASEISAQNSSMTSLSFLSAYSWIFFSGSSRRAISPAETKGKIENHFFKKKRKGNGSSDLVEEKAEIRKKKKGEEEGKIDVGPAEVRAIMSFWGRRQRCGR